jgi:hypothetical protein
MGFILKDFFSILSCSLTVPVCSKTGCLTFLFNEFPPVKTIKKEKNMLGIRVADRAALIVLEDFETK